MAVTERMQNAGYRDFDSFDRNGFVEVIPFGEQVACERFGKERPVFRP